MMALGMPIPDTWMVPPKTYEPSPGLKPTLSRYANLFYVRKIGDRIGWPMFRKPYDGGGWRAVTKVDDAAAVYKADDESGKSVMHLQAAVNGFDRFARCIGLGPQTHCVLYDPEAPLHDRYTMKTDFISKAECVSQFDRAHSMQTARKLQEARASFLASSAAACPNLVREDYTRSLVELQRALPTVVFSACADGRDVARHASCSTARPSPPRSTATPTPSACTTAAPPRVINLRVTHSATSSSSPTSHSASVSVSGQSPWLPPPGSSTPATESWQRRGSAPATERLASQWNARTSSRALVTSLPFAGSASFGPSPRAPRPRRSSPRSSRARTRAS